MASQYLAWSQMSGLPDDLLDDPMPQARTWSDLASLWSPTKPLFCASLAWQNALIALNLPTDDTHLGLTQGLFDPFQCQSTISSLKPCTKADKLLFQISSTIKNRTVKVSDPTGEALCSLHPEIMAQHNLNEGTAIIAKNLTILPGLLINLTVSNIVKIFT